MRRPDLTLAVEHRVAGVPEPVGDAGVKSRGFAFVQKVRLLTQHFYTHFTFENVQAFVLLVMYMHGRAGARAHLVFNLNVLDTIAKLATEKCEPLAMTIVDCNGIYLFHS